MQNPSATMDQITAWDTKAVSEFDTGDMDVLVLERSPLEHIGSIVEAGRIHALRGPSGAGRGGAQGGYRQQCERG